MATESRKEATRRACAPTLGGDVLLEVLARLPAKSLLRFKSLCKSWHATIRDPHFISLHHHRSKSTSMSKQRLLIMAPTIQPRQVNLYSYSEGEGTIAKLSLSEAIPWVPTLNFWCRPLQCDGLLLAFASEEIYVGNPSTMELLALPPGRDDHEFPYKSVRDPMVGFGFDSRAKKYKVVRCFCSFLDPVGLRHTQAMEVFTLGGADSSWRLLAEQPPYPIDRITPASLRRAVYWRIGQDRWISFYSEVLLGEEPALVPKGFLRFDLSDESFSLVPGPPVPWPDRGFKFHLADLDDERLCFLHFGSGNAEVKMWVAEDGRNPTWAIFCTIDISLQQQQLLSGDLPIPCALSSDGMLILQIHETLFSCDPQTGELRQCFDLGAEKEFYSPTHPLNFPNMYSRFQVVRCPESLLFHVCDLMKLLSFLLCSFHSSRVTDN